MAFTREVCCILVLCACGRINFDQLSVPGDGSGDSADSGGDAPTVACSPSSGVIPGTSVRGQSLAFSGSGFAMTWVDRRTSIDQLHFIHIGLSGPPSSDVTVTSAPGGVFNDNSLTRDGTRYATVWWEFPTGPMHLALLDEAGQIVDQTAADFRDAPPTPNLTLLFPIVSDASGLGIGINDFRTSAPRVYLSRVDRSLARIGADLELVPGQPESQLYQLVPLGTAYGLVYALGADLYVGVRAFDGTAIGTDQLVGNTGPGIAAGNSSGSQVASTWFDGTQLMLARLGSDLSLIGTAAVPASGVGSGGMIYYQDVAWANDHWFVGWIDDETASHSVHLSEISTAGTQLGVPDVMQISSAGAYFDLAVAAGGGGEIAVWSTAAGNAYQITCL